MIFFLLLTIALLHGVSGFLFLALSDTVQAGVLQILNTGLNLWMLLKAAKIQADAAETKQIVNSRVDDLPIRHEDRRA